MYNNLHMQFVSKVNELTVKWYLFNTFYTFFILSLKEIPCIHQSQCRPVHCKNNRMLRKYTMFQFSFTRHRTNFDRNCYWKWCFGYWLVYSTNSCFLFTTNFDKFEWMSWYALQKQWNKTVYQEQCSCRFYHIVICHCQRK